MNLFQTLRNSKSEDWTDSLYWLIYSVLLGLLPIWIGLLLPGMTFFSYAKNGDILIFCTTLITSQLYVLSKDSRLRVRKDKIQMRLKVEQVPCFRLFFTFIIIIIFASLILFFIERFSPELVADWMMTGAIILLIFSTIVGFFLTVVVNSSIVVDLSHWEFQQADDFRKNFDKSFKG